MPLHVYLSETPESRVQIYQVHGGIGQSLCPNDATCAPNYAIDSANYTISGISTPDDCMTLQNVASSSGHDSITAEWCLSLNGFITSLDGLTTKGEALGRGMALVFGIGNDNG